jgi:hypothetical protein
MKRDDADLQEVVNANQRCKNGAKNQTDAR